MQALLKNIGLREMRLVLFGLGAVITIGVCAGLILPQVKALRATHSAVAVLREASLDGTELDRHINEQHELIDTLRYRVYGDMEALPPRQMESYIIGRLQKVSWDNNVELVSVQPTMGQQIEVFQEMLFRVQLVGRYRDLYAWLWESRNDLGFIVVEELNLSRNDNVDAEPLLKANLSLASYRRLE